MPRSRTLAFGLAALGAVFVVIGVLYGVGAIEILTSTGHGRHTTHLILFLALAVVSLLGARFAWPARRAA